MGVRPVWGSGRVTGSDPRGMTTQGSGGGKDGRLGPLSFVQGDGGVDYPPRGLWSELFTVRLSVGVNKVSIEVGSRTSRLVSPDLH